MTSSRRVEVDRAHQQLVAAAAAQLRHRAIVAGYAGLPSQHVAFSLALLLDELVRHLRELDEDVRHQTLTTAQTLLDPTDPPPSP